MTQPSPSRQLRFLSLVMVTTALALSATMSVSYARPFGTGGYGGYGGYGASGIVQGR